MQPEAQGSYDAFLHTGKINDYLKYIDQKQQVTNATGETFAYYDGRNRAAGAADGRN